MTDATPPHRLALHEDMTIYQAAEQKNRLLAALAEARHLALDLSGVAEIDTAGLQLLMLVKREAGRQGKTLEICGHSPAVQQTLDFCNLVGVFGDPMVISARA
jgi:anti-anti-sigma factor